MRHEVLFLNSRRSYVRVNETWYDTHKEHSPQKGQGFLLGAIEEVLEYETYTKTYPESKREIFYEVNDKTHSGGYLRKVSDRKMAAGEYNRAVEYAVNPLQPTLVSKKDIELN
jgi:hypothetical protein